MINENETEYYETDESLEDGEKSVDLSQFVGRQNIASDIPNLDAIGLQVMRDYETDDSKFGTRKKRIEDLYKLALQVIETKDYPFEGAANIKFPILTRAALNFAALAYPAIVQGDEVVKGKVIGNDDGDEEIEGADGKPIFDPEKGEPIRKNAGLKQKIAERVGEFMSWQVLEDMSGWQDDMDKILHIIPIVGCAFKKTYYDPSMRKSISKLVLPQFLIINIDAQNVESAARISEVLQLYPHEIQENINMGIFEEFDYSPSTETLQDNYKDSEGNQGSDYDADQPHVFIEQHRRLDLDDDGYSEPYIVWVHKQSGKVCRILPRYEMEDILYDQSGKVLKIEGQNFYSKFGLIPDPEGSPYDIGFGHLVQHLNVATNTTINQMLDQGHMYTLGGGFIGAGLRMKSGTLRFKPNDWKRVQTGGMSLRDNIVPLPTKEPSVVLMGLLEFLVRGAEQITALNTFAAGEFPANMPAVSAMASLEQGLQPFKAVFKRIHRSLRGEFKRLFYLNKLYLSQEDYSRVLDDRAANVELDFMTGAADVIPVSDPDIVTNLQSMMRAQALLELKDDPLMDGVEIRKRALKAMNIKDSDALVKIPPDSPDPVAEAQVMALTTQIKDLESQMAQRMMDTKRKDRELDLKIEKAVFEIGQIKADTVKTMSEVDSTQAKMALSVYDTHLNHLTQLKKELADERNQSNGMGQMEIPPNNQEIL